jgi:hypothetical protein
MWPRCVSVSSCGLATLASPYAILAAPQPIRSDGRPHRISIEVCIACCGGGLSVSQQESQARHRRRQSSFARRADAARDALDRYPILRTSRPRLPIADRAGRSWTHVFRTPIGHERRRRRIDSGASYKLLTQVIIWLREKDWQLTFFSEIVSANSSFAVGRVTTSDPFRKVHGAH